MKVLRGRKLLCLLCALLMLLSAMPSAMASEDALRADVVVVGGGLAGLTAALSASDNGASVILVEKLAMLGGSSGYSGGGIGAVETDVQARFGIEDSQESWRELWVARQSTSPDSGSIYPDMARVDWIIENGASLIEWMQALGVVYPRPEGYGVDPVERLHFPQKQGEAEGVTGMGMNLIKYLSDAADEKGVTIMLETRATELIQDDGAVTGIVAETKEGPITIEAGSVVLASGGFAQSTELLNRFIPELPEVTSVASPGCTGDGILMAEAAGAALYEDPWIIGLYTGTEARSALSNLTYIANLYVAPNGERVMNEAQHYAIITNDAIEAGGVLYMIYDSSSPDLAGLIEANLDHAFKGETYEELAQAAGIDAAAFAATMDAYNGYALADEDAQFGKAPELLYPVTAAPYYAIKVLPNIMGTIGGGVANTTGEVLSAAGDAIPGLYAAGECANRPYYNQVYMSGSALAVAATTGRYAGESAAAYAK